MKRLVFGWVCCAIGLLMLGVPLASASNIESNVTMTIQNLTFVLFVTNPCTGADAAGTFAVNAVLHETTLKDGTFWATFTETGNFTLVQGTFTVDSSGNPNGLIPDPTLPTYAGVITIWDGANGNERNFAFTSTFVVNAFGSDGSKITFTMFAHLSTSASGLIETFTMGSVMCR